jgi:DNA (cytosine-5)-methyltransferase 1
MPTPRLLDLFCGAGGAAMGYHMAGFEVTGVDIKPQPHYPFAFVQADALTFPLGGYDMIHASPPCQRFSVASVIHRNHGKKYSDLLTPMRQRLIAWGGLWVIENVLQAPMEQFVCLCGLMFGLKVFRHRLFECSAFLLTPSHPSHGTRKIGEGYYSIAGNGGRWKTWGTVVRDVSKGTVTEWRQAMEIDWMTRQELSQAIPPAYTQFIGAQLR